MSLFTSVTVALCLAGSPSPAFTAQGRPIHPLCITGLTVGEPHPGPALLSTCGKTKEPVEHKDGEFSWTAGELTGMRREFSSYRVLGQQGGEWVIAWEWCGGGTGIFTGVSLLRLERGTLQLVRTVATGDRCNGGLRDSRLEKGVLRYSRAATPVDLLESVPEGRALGLGTGENFERSALSCFATLEYAGGELTGAELEDPGADRPGWTDTSRYQACYNALQRDFLTSGRARLDPAGVTGFVRAFSQRCLGHPDAH